jgi:hypothetical protein
MSTGREIHDARMTSLNSSAGSGKRGNEPDHTEILRSKRRTHHKSLWAMAEIWSKKVDGIKVSRLA